MELESRISFLTKILSNCSLEQINHLYKDVELKTVIEGFERNPEVRYSDEMKKRIIKEARAARIPQGRLKFIGSLVEKSMQDYTEDQYAHVESQATQFLSQLKTLEFYSKMTYLICLEHDYSPAEVLCHLCQNFDAPDYPDKPSIFYTFQSPFNFEDQLGIFNSLRFAEMSEQLEILDIEGEEFPQIFYELSTLKTYALLKKIFNRKPAVDLIHKDPWLASARIDIQKHDSWSYKIYPSSFED